MYSQESEKSDIQKVEVFGDSIFKGIQWNPETRRYHVDNHIDIDLISEQYSISIGNHSKFGCTVKKGYDMITPRVAGGKFCDAVVMDFGGNDCDFDWKAIAENPTEEHTPKIPLAEFMALYRKIIGSLKGVGILPILTTLPPLAPQRFFNWFCGGLNQANILDWLWDVNAIYRYQENYSRTVERIAQEEDIPLVDLRGAFLRNPHIEHLLCQDGIHPNTEGQRVITSAFLEFAEGRRTRRRAGSAL